MSNKIIFIHGTKGGVGKSMCAAVLTDYMINAELEPTILESDGTAPDVGLRFKAVCNTASAPITDAESIYNAVDEIEKTGAKNIIVNLPANADVIDSIADEIKDMTAILGYEMRTIFMLGEGSDSARLALESLESGLIGASTVAAAVVNGRFGSDPEKFAWFNSKEHSEWIEKHPEFYMPELNRRVIETDAFKEHVTFSHLASIKSNTTTVNRVLMCRWLQACEPICEHMTKEVSGAENE